MEGRDHQQKGNQGDGRGGVRERTQFRPGGHHHRRARVRQQRGAGRTAGNQAPAEQPEHGAAAFHVPAD